MSLPTIEIKGKKYPEPSINRMKRKQIKKLNPVLKRVQGEDLDAIWDMVSLLVPGLTATVLDDLELGECKDILAKSGVVTFEDDKPADGESEPADSDAITVGESSASTDS
ncbi:hypothetical protein ACT3UQ_08715 [Glutamicibacter sp. AOP12-B1-11]|uniref:hypothetical protein n=1 Tax=Glutamicibacter sp. AOP12-B1-11 TaxID=3457725 RepID=UPI004033F966